VGRAPRAPLYQDVAALRPPVASPASGSPKGSLIFLVIRFDTGELFASIISQQRVGLSCRSAPISACQGSLKPATSREELRSEQPGLFLGAMNELNVNLQHSILTLAGNAVVS
jgi:hypothetical protein